MSFIGIDIAGNKELAAKLEQIPGEAFGAGVEEANKYIVDVERIYPPRVQHGADNPYQWQSEKQRRAYFASNGFGGGIPSQRSQGLSKGWKTIGQGRNQIVVNEVPYAMFVKDVQRQRGHAADGWDTIGIDIQTRMGQIVRKFEFGVSRALKKLGLQK